MRRSVYDISLLVVLLDQKVSFGPKVYRGHSFFHLAQVQLLRHDDVMRIVSYNPTFSYQDTLEKKNVFLIETKNLSSAERSPRYI